MECNCKDVTSCKKLSVGDKAPDFNFATPWNFENSFYKSLNGKKSVLVFLRYYGCTVCQLQIIDYIDNYDKFVKKDMQLFVVLQSEPETISSQNKKGDIPFTVICDPSQELYKLYNTKMAKDKDGLHSQELLKKVERIKKLGLAHGKYEGNELQLPVMFIIDEKGTIEFLHYGNDAGDVPEIEELLER